ncbi:MAG: ABC transporter ATP-binding protein [Candidatus Saccharibacteria bacterium]|nr:ABC transporter ATP-binding protein [Candidatus Saccharibacteria bacterium]MDO4967300.1 ABC transporter ATP-binding protein [Candidatus Saccharibacteria bacterium]
MNTLKVENLSYSYQNASGTQKVLDDVNAEFKAGKMYAIVGESGSGKTTLLSLISALDKLQDGDIKYNSKSLKRISGQEFRLKYVNIVFQSYNLIKYMTARENVEVASDFDGRKVDPDKYLSKVGISSEEGRRLIGKLSGGQQQRVAIARALASNSPIIMADEPTGNLDEDTEEKIIEIFKELAHKENKIVIIVTHSRQVANKADKVLTLRRGKLS